MAELFLTSSIHAVASHIATKIDLSIKNKLVFITTPAETKRGDLTWLKNDRLALVHAGWDVTDYSITGKDRQTIFKDLVPYDYIYMSGGDTWYLLQQSYRTKFIEVIKELVNDHNKIYISTSAGSIITGPSIPEYLIPVEINNETNTQSYGFVNFTIVPHWGREDFKKKYLEMRLKVAYKTPQVPLILLTDNHYIHVVDTKTEIIDISSV